MSGFLLDTNVISEQRKGQRTNPGVSRWFHDHLDDEMWLSVLVVGELRRGVALLERRDAAAAGVIGSWLDSVVEDYHDRILPVTAQVAERWALLGVPNPVSEIDGLLAATALEHSLTLVTRNVNHVKRTGVGFVNPFLET